MQKAHRLVHLDVPWNPMDLEQRIGRVHRFGSRKTVIIDTVVAAGSREIDMYRIAREKLALVARQLDPDQFENLYGRVMSLVPPKELEWILGDVQAGAHLDRIASDRIGQLVQEGFRSWNEFDNTYRKQAEDIRNAPAGQASWADVLNFLVKHGGATIAAGASYGTFRFDGEEIVDIEESVPGVVLKGQTYACGDTGGLPAVDGSGATLPTIGMGMPDLQALLEASFVADDGTGLAWLRRSAGMSALPGGRGHAYVHAFMQQSIQFSDGVWQEVGYALKLFAHDGLGEPFELNPADAASFIRECQVAQRLRNSAFVGAGSRFEALEVELTGRLRRPSDADIEQGVRHAVWPLAIVAVVPEKAAA